MRGRPTKREREREREREGEREKERERERKYAQISGKRKIIVFAQVFHILILKELMS